MRRHRASLCMPYWTKPTGNHGESNIHWDTFCWRPRWSAVRATETQPSQQLLSMCGEQNRGRRFSLTWKTWIQRVIGFFLSFFFWETHSPFSSPLHHLATAWMSFCVVLCYAMFFWIVSFFFLLWCRCDIKCTFFLAFPLLDKDLNHGCPLVRLVKGGVFLLNQSERNYWSPWAGTTPSSLPLFYFHPSISSHRGTYPSPSVTLALFYPRVVNQPRAHKQRHALTHTGALHRYTHTNHFAAPRDWKTSISAALSFRW